MIALDISDRRWLEFVEGCSMATAFHHPSWAKMLARCYRYRTFALAKTDRAGEIIAGIPVIEVRTAFSRRRWVSLPFTDQCAPLARSTTDFSALAEELLITQRVADVSSLEIRSPLDGSGRGRSLVAVTHSLRLTGDPDILSRGFKRSSVRRQIRKAERDGVEIRHSNSQFALTETFYRLHLETRRRLGVPIQPRRYFDLLWTEILQPGLGFVLLAYVKDIPIAGAVFLKWNGTVTYKYGASVSNYWHLHPNHLLMWTAIRWSCENGYHTFDFGRSDLPSKGLREFKDSWGAQEEPLIYTTLGDRAVRLSSGRMHAAVGAVLRQSPTWMSRVVGELLYRYAA